MPRIQATNLTFTYDGSYDPVFEDLSFTLDTNWRTGLVGRNGKGKTTLLRLLCGELASKSISSDVNGIYFPFLVEHPERKTEEVLRGINRAFLTSEGSPAVEEYQDWELVRELSRLQVPAETLERPFHTLSNGEKTKCLLAALFLQDNGFLLIDEPTNHLDAEGRRVVSDYLRTKPGFLLVSHDRAFLDGCVDHIFALNRTDVEVQKGNFSSWWENRERRNHFEAVENEKHRREAKRLENAAQRASNWSTELEKTKYGSRNSGLRPDRGYIGHKSAKMMKRAKAMETRLEAAAVEQKKLLQNLETTEALKLFPERYHAERLVSFSHVSVFYGERLLHKDLSFSISRGERVVLRGKNGCGKTTLFRLLLGEIDGQDLHYTGALFRGSGLKISYVPQDTTGLSGPLQDFAFRCGIDDPLFRAILRKLDFSRTQFEKDLSMLSEGQKKKVLLARSLCQRAHLYLWDEPLNYIDVFSRMQIEALLLEYAPTMMLVEHDQTFADRVATKEIWL